VGRRARGAGVLACALDTLPPALQPQPPVGVPKVLAPLPIPRPRRRYALPRLRWLGVVSGMLGDVPRSAFHPLSARDASLLPGLRSRLAGHRAWLEELQEMEDQVSGRGARGGAGGEGGRSRGPHSRSS
jgi:hypothetical protein